MTLRRKVSPPRELEPIGRMLSPIVAGQPNASRATTKSLEAAWGAGPGQVSGAAAGDEIAW